MAQVRLTSRDWILLALCSVGTVLGLCALWVATVRITVPNQEFTDEPCMILDNPNMPVLGRPNTSCSPVLHEIGKIEYRFNGCGHRTDLPCGPAPPGTFRIVVLGSSMVEGAGVAVEDTFVSRLAPMLERATGRKYDAYSAGMVGSSPRGVLLRLDEIFPLKPDFVLWPVTVFDLDHVNLRTFGVSGKQAPDERRPREQLLGTPSVRPKDESGWAGIYNRAEDSRYVFFLKHFLYQSPSAYESHYGSPGDPASGGEFAGYIEKNPPQSWREHLEDFEFYFRQIASKLKQRGIPLTVVLLPDRIQAGMISTGRWPAGESPYALSSRLEPIVRRYGAGWFDILHDFRRVPDTQRLYFPVNGHMNLEGHKVLAKVISQELAKSEFADTSFSARNTP